MMRTIRIARLLISKLLIMSWLGLFRFKNRRWIFETLSTIDFLKWASREFEAPAPRSIKMAVLIRNQTQGGVWLETGTYVGETTKFLSENSPHVISIEPSYHFFQIAKSNLKRIENIHLVNDTSENVFESMLFKMGKLGNFWLDGHYSGGETHQGLDNTPIKTELEIIRANSHRFSSFTVFIDDMRCFKKNTVEEYSNYPSLDWVSSWAESLDLDWVIEHDIFIAKTRK
jgi:hypothetical protein